MLESDALVMGELVVTVLTNNLVVFTIVTFADVAVVGESWLLLHVDSISCIFQGLRLFDLDFIQYFRRINGVKLLKHFNLYFAKRANIVELCPSQDAVEAEIVFAALRLCALGDSVEANRALEAVVLLFFLYGARFLQFLFSKLPLSNQLLDFLNNRLAALGNLFWFFLYESRFELGIEVGRGIF